ncbi:predicted protein [Histoplasma capsulatum G186AR]|uniref:Uncharacterized protein n=1 Tax=Ajellomyces capsulatus (strain G186AR / H82 / ATCC MYA-2454 / RMSCC 2432) TaxID=447093 RepID=C0NND2_AJECG|nr:uncharacterized protein HCBG_04259 [Histoplasma capsulatum G186AR]EEH07380.1 predicted protein [Histoplasma capsulatum G186AR]
MGWAAGKKEREPAAIDDGLRYGVLQGQIQPAPEKRSRGPERGQQLRRETTDHPTTPLHRSQTTHTLALAPLSTGERRGPRQGQTALSGACGLATKSGETKVLVLCN